MLDVVPLAAAAAGALAAGAAAARYLRSLPSRAEYRRALAERLLLMAEKADLERRLRDQVARDARQLARFHAEADAMREEIDRLKHRQVTTAEHQSLRDRLHKIRGAAQ